MAGKHLENILIGRVAGQVEAVAEIIGETVTVLFPGPVTQAEKCRQFRCAGKGSPARLVIQGFLAEPVT